MNVEYPLKKWSKNGDPAEIAKERWKIAWYSSTIHKSRKASRSSKNQDQEKYQEQERYTMKNMLSINTEKQIPRLAIKSKERNQDLDIWEKQD